MHKIAIIQFPGTNCELESIRALKKAGLEPVLFRWNEDKKKLEKFDGYFLAGGFSYEDRVRSGVIAAHDPIVKFLKQEAKKLKPIIGICNGAQILVEAGLIPGVGGNCLAASLARNNRGYLNRDVYIINSAEEGRCAFNNFKQNHFFKLPIAHGEGRFVIEESLLKKIIENGQTVFRYCDKNGLVKDEYPINPNGAIYNLAGICNPAGNVLALMPHPERVDGGQIIFKSIKKYLENKNSTSPRPSATPLLIRRGTKGEVKLRKYQKNKNNLEILVELIITDNEAQTLETALNNLGLEVKLKRFVHWELDIKNKNQEKINKIIKTGELLNENKELFYLDQKKINNKNYKILVRDKNDFTGREKLDNLKNRLGFKDIKNIQKAVLWELECSPQTLKEILKTNILFNPVSQEGLAYN